MSHATGTLVATRSFGELEEMLSAIRTTVPEWAEEFKQLMTDDLPLAVLMVFSKHRDIAEVAMTIVEGAQESDLVRPVLWRAWRRRDDVVISESRLRAALIAHGCKV